MKRIEQIKRFTPAIYTMYNATSVTDKYYLVVAIEIQIDARARRNLVHVVGV